MEEPFVVALVLGILALLGFFWFRVAPPVRPRSAASIPEALESALQLAHPNARVVRWTRESRQLEAEFNDGDTPKKTWLMLTSAGAITETEVQITPAELLAPVTERLMTYYKSYEITEAALIRPDSGGVMYEAEFTQGLYQRGAYMWADGTKIKNTEKKTTVEPGL